MLRPTGNHNAYKTIRNKITNLVRAEKRQANFHALDRNSPKTKHETFKSKMW